jgi:hypothetical protein
MARCLTLLMMLVSAPAFAQIDFSGEWAPRFHEDQPERVPGPELGDYLGIPISQAARLRGMSWDASIMTLPEWQCRPHSADYIWRGPSPLKITKEVDPVSREITAFRAVWLRSVERPVYMDGRPHPPSWAPHTWAGFSTGKWEGNMLTITTTHLKEGYLRRNGLPRSDKATLTEHWIRNGDILTVVTIIKDPVYLTEPFVRTTDYELDLNQHVPPYPCSVEEEIDRPKGIVPHHLPGTNPYLDEFAAKHHLPVEATRGGAETMYPEYRAKLNTGSSKTAPPAAVPASQATPRPAAPIDLTGTWVSIVTEDWRWRMVTPSKGDYSSVPLTPQARTVADAWDPAKDEAAGEQCRAFGAPGVMRVPGRIRVSWEDPATLKVETEAGAQTRVFHFDAHDVDAAQPGWQGQSIAQWVLPGSRRRQAVGVGVEIGGGPPAPGGSLKVVTTGLRPGYLRRNGIPYGANALVTEHYNRMTEENGDAWLVVTTIVEDPQYLTGRFITSTHFKKVPDGSGWNPVACTAR